MSDIGTVEQQQTKAFVSKPYNKEEKIKKDEEELKQLLAEQKGETEEAKKAEEETKEEESLAPEEKTFKKRYGDLRRHNQEEKQKFEAKIAELNTQLAVATEAQIKLPKSEEEISEWAQKYPDVSQIIETIAIKKADERAKQVEDRVKEAEKIQEQASKEKAEAKLMQLHPDFDEIRNSDDFHDWADNQPNWVQKALYENDSDAFSAARAIDLYKADKAKENVGKEKKSKTTKAASSVATKGSRTAPQTEDTKGAIKESDVQAMSGVEYEKNADKIMEAIQSGKFIYDISGSAR
jgi:hypothetical protein